MKYFLLPISVCTLMACQQQQSNDRASAPADTTGNTARATTQCYAFTSAADTIQMTLDRSGVTATGELAYRLSGKDRNTGTFSGTFYGDTLLADYTFQSEGVTSVREIAFVAKGHEMVEGFGPVSEQSGKMVFTKRSQLTFNKSFALVLTDCPNP